MGVGGEVIDDNIAFVIIVTKVVLTNIVVSDNQNGACSQVMKMVKSGEFDRVIIDTAPTGYVYVQGNGRGNGWWWWE